MFRIMRYSSTARLICSKSLMIEFEISKPLIILNIYNYCKISYFGCSPLGFKVLQKAFLVHFLELDENLRVSNVPKAFFNTENKSTLGSSSFW